MPLSVKNAPLHCPVTVKSTLHCKHNPKISKKNSIASRYFHLTIARDRYDRYEKDQGCQPYKILKAGKYISVCLGSV